MRGPTTAGSLSTHVPITGGGTTDPSVTASPSGSGLANRVTTAPSAPPRAGVLQRIGSAIVRGLKSLFSARGSAARGSGPERLQREFQQSLQGVKDALLAPNATTAVIRASLLAADAAAIKLQGTSGATGESIHHSFRQAFEKASPEELARIGALLNSSEIENLQSELVHREHALQLIVGAHVALHAEITSRVESNVSKQIDAALGVIKNGGPEARITEHLQLACSAAAPLVKRNALEAGSTTNSDVRRTVRNELDRLPDETRRTLLTHLSREDLNNLAQAGEGSKEPIQHAIEAEIQERPRRLAADLETRAQGLAARYGTDKAIDRSAFLRDLSSIIRRLDVVDQHVCRFDVTSPPELADIQQAVAKTLQQVIASGKLDLNALVAVEICELTTAFCVLGAEDTANELLADAQRKMLGQCCDNLERSLQKLGIELISGRDPETVLKRLADATKASMALENTSNTLGSAVDKLNLPASEGAIIKKWFRSLSIGAKQALANAIIGPQFGPLIKDLDDATQAARAANERTLASQFRQMGDLLLEIQNYIAGELHISADVAPPAPASEPMRKALSKLYGVEVSGSQTTLNAGRFSAEQTDTVARDLQRPLSANALKPAQLGKHTVTENFLVDARRRVPLIWINDASGVSTPLIDHENWPNDIDDPDYRQRDVRIAAGYERLIAFSGGDEEQARALVTHMNQQIVAGLATACMHEDSPMRLENGTAGPLLENTHDGGGGKLEVDVSLAIGENGRPQLDIGYHAEGRNTLAPATGGMPITLSRDSMVQMDFRAELNHDGGLTLLNIPSYRFSMKQDEFQKPYALPNAAFLRSAPQTHAGLVDAATFAQSIGKDYQITALRAANVFAQKPTAQNAVAVIAECNRGGEEAAGLVSQEVRQKVAGEVENKRQGVIAAFDAAVHAAEKIVAQNQGNMDFYNAKEFLAQVKDLNTKPWPSLQEHAEELYEAYIKPLAVGTARPLGGHTLPINREIATQTGQHLATQRQSAAEEAFAPELFGNLLDKLSRHIDTDVLPGMVDAVRRGEI